MDAAVATTANTPLMMSRGASAVRVVADTLLCASTQRADRETDGFLLFRGSDPMRPKRRALAVHIPVGVFVVVGVLVAAPLIGRGYLLLLDWMSGPHPHLPRAAWG